MNGGRVGRDLTSLGNVSNARLAFPTARVCSLRPVQYEGHEGKKINQNQRAQAYNFCVRRAGKARIGPWSDKVPVKKREEGVKAMAVRATIFSGVFATALVFLAAPARADLITTPPSTVDALFYLGAPVTGSPTETEDFGSPPMAGPAPIGAGGVLFVEGVEDLSTIQVGAVQIIITNLAPSGTAFCSVTTTPCPDTFTGFKFLFSAGVDISGVSVDPASAADFRPLTGGLQLSSPTEITVNVAGDAPNTDDQLILDLSFPSASVPEPSSLALLAASLLAIVHMEKRRRRG